MLLLFRLIRVNVRQFADGLREGQPPSLPAGTSQECESVVEEPGWACRPGRTPAAALLLFSGRLLAPFGDGAHSVLPAVSRDVESTDEY